MNPLNIVFLFLFGACSGLVEPPCGKTISNLWLDVVLVIDNSKGMTRDGLVKAAGGIGGIFGTDIRLGVNPYQPKTTRVGIVAYSDTATTVADLDDIQSLGDLHRKLDSIPISSSTQSYVASGLIKAQEMLATRNRDKFQKVVVVFASSYKQTGRFDPIRVADQMKADGYKIITVAFTQRGDPVILEKLANIASEGFNFTNAGKIIRPVREALMQANCHCPEEWAQFIDSNNTRYKTCIQLSTQGTTWPEAKYACSTIRNNSYLHTEFNSEKQNFVRRQASDIAYYTGLHRMGAVWQWEKPDGSFYPLVGEVGEFQSWDEGYPKSNSNFKAVVNVFTNGKSKWQNRDESKELYYFCETIAFDTDTKF